MGTPSSWALCRVFVGVALLSFAGLRRTAWAGDSGGSYQLTVTAAYTTVQASTPVTFECEVEPKVNS